MRGRKGELDYRGNVRKHMYKLRAWLIRDRGLGFMHAVCSRSLQLHLVSHLVRHLSGVRSRKGSGYGIELMYELRAWLILDGGLGFMHSVCSRSLQLHPIRHLVRYLSGVRDRKGSSCRIEHMHQLCQIILDDRSLDFMHAVCSRSLQLHPIRHYLRNLPSVRSWRDDDRGRLKQQRAVCVPSRPLHLRYLPKLLPSL